MQQAADTMHMYNATLSGRHRASIHLALLMLLLSLPPFLLGVSYVLEYRLILVPGNIFSSFHFIATGRWSSDRGFLLFVPKMMNFDDLCCLFSLVVIGSQHLVSFGQPYF